MTMDMCGIFDSFWPIENGLWRSLEDEIDGLTFRIERFFADLKQKDAGKQMD